MLPSPSELAYFAEVAKTENISRAAERLGVTQPTLSASLQKLENTLNAQILLRSRSGVKLTPAGKELLSKSRELLNMWEQIKNDVAKNKNEISGTYIIATHVSVALYSLRHFLPELISRHPELNVKLVHGLSRQMTEKVISLEADFGIVVNPVDHPDLVIHELCKDEVTFWRSKKTKSNEDVLIFDGKLAQSQKLVSDMKKKGLNFKRFIECPSLEVISDLTAKGTGVGILPTRVAHLSSDLKLVTKSGKPISIYKDRICLVYRPDYQKSLAAKTIIDAIKKAVI